MPQVREHALDALLTLLARYADAWPALCERSAELLGYLARHGAWHLARSGQFPEAVDFLGRLLAYEGREALLSPQQQNAALVDGLLALSTCPPERAAAVDAATLVTLLLAVQDRGVVRPGCIVMARRSLDEIGAAFAAYPNPSAAVAYVLAEELARTVLQTDDREGWAALASAAADSDHPVQYSALYAFKYVGCERPDWLTTEAVRPFAVAGPYDRLAATTMLLFLALQGDPFPTGFDVPEFWLPRWRYNAEEVELLRGAMLFRGLVPSESPEDDALAAPFRDAEARRLSVLARLGPDDSFLLSILEDYWRLTTRMEDLGRLGAVLRGHAVLEEVVWLLMVSPLWEVSEAGSAFAARLASSNEHWEARLEAWATGDDQASWWGALVALRLLADRTGREKALGEAVRAQARCDSAQLRGNCANTLQTWIAGAGPARREALLTAFEEELRILVHGDDVWAVNEILHLLEALGDQRDHWAQRLRVDESPLVRLTPTWREVAAAGWGDTISERLEERRIE